MAVTQMNPILYIVLMAMVLSPVAILVYIGYRAVLDYVYEGLENLDDYIRN